MSSGRCWILSLFLFSSAAGASGISIPPILDGSLAGNLFPFGQTKLGIHWVVTAATAGTGARSLSLELTGPGLGAAAAVELDPNGRSGSWIIRSAEVDLAHWLEPIATRYFPDSADFQVAGKIAVAGEGTLTGSAYSGALRFNLTVDSLADAAGAWSLSDVSGVLTCPDLPARTSAGPQQLTFRELNVAEILLKNGVIDYEIESGDRIHVRQIRAEALGGIITCGEFVVDSARSPVEAVLRAEGIELDRLKNYLPQAVAEAHGRVDLQLRVRWSGASGFEMGRGTLKLRPDSNASLRLARAPGFLSSQVPARIELAPTWMGRLGRVFSQVFPARKTLESIENGEEALIVESIEAEFRPADQDADTTAILRIVAHPTKTDVVKKVRLNIKVTGPLADVMRYGLDDRVSFGP